MDQQAEAVAASAATALDHEEDLYVCVAATLRHHFKHERGQKDNQQIVDARRTRSAALVAQMLTETRAFRLYSRAIEADFSKKFHLESSRSRLEQFTLAVLTQVNHVEAEEKLFELAALSQNTTLPSLLQVQRQIVFEVESSLNDCDVYLGLLEKTNRAIRFTVCSRNSRMSNQMLYNVPSAQGQHVQNLPTLVQQAQEPNQNATHDIPLSFEAIQTNEPVLCQDVAAEPRIHRFGEYSRTGPFACFPMPNDVGNARIGVLCIDACRKAQTMLFDGISISKLCEFLVRMKVGSDAVQVLKKEQFDGRRFLQLTVQDINHDPIFARLKPQSRHRLYEVLMAVKANPSIHLREKPQFFIDDQDEVNFLTQMALLSGKCLAVQRRLHWQRELARVTKDTNCSELDVYETLVQGVIQSLCFVEKCLVLRIEKRRPELGHATTQSSRVSSHDEPLISCVACDELPNDRLMAFEYWNEYTIKRMTVHKENFPCTTSLVKGSITRIVQSESQRKSPRSSTHTTNKITNNNSSPRVKIPRKISSRRSPKRLKSARTSNQSPTAPKQLSQPSECVSNPRERLESAVFCVQWRFGKAEVMPWKRLQQLLAVRPLNPRHFQLKRILQALHEQPTSNSLKFQDWPAVIRIIHDSFQSKDVCYVLQVDFSAEQMQQAQIASVPRSYKRFLKRSVKLTEQSLECVRGRQMRQHTRQQSMDRAVKRFGQIAFVPCQDALQSMTTIVNQVAEEITTNLPGCEIYIGELQADNEHLVYTFCFNGCSLRDRELYRGQGVSFSCLDQRSPLVVQFGSALHKRMKCLGRQEEIHDEGAFPYVLVPLVHEDAVVGILGVNQFAKMPMGRTDESHPEPGVVDFLSSLAKPLATSIRLKRRAFALFELQGLLAKPLVSPAQLFFHFCHVIKRLVIGNHKVRLMHMDMVRGQAKSLFELSDHSIFLSQQPDFLVVEPLTFRHDELLADTVAELLETSMEEATRLLNVAKLRPPEPKEDWKRRYFHLLLGDKACGFSKQDQASKWNDRMIQHEIGTALGNSDCLLSSIPLLCSLQQGVFLACSNFSNCLFRSDQAFVDHCGDTLSKSLEVLMARITRMRRRIDKWQEFDVFCQFAVQQALESIMSVTSASVSASADAPAPKKRANPNKTRSMPPQEEMNREILLGVQQRAVNLIEEVLMGCDVYCAMHEPVLGLLRYTTASKQSQMKSKKLKRGKSNVSFACLDKQVAICVETADQATGLCESKYGTRLRLMAAPSLAQQKWPFLVVPVAHAGVLALDNLENYAHFAKEKQPELGVMDFVRKIGLRLGQAVNAVRDSSAQMRRDLRKKALMEVLRVCDDRNHPQLFLERFVLDQIDSALNGVNAYIGMVQPFCEHIVFTSGTLRTQMVNQQVNTTRSVSFQVFALHQSVVIPSLQRFVKSNETVTLRPLSDAVLEESRHASTRDQSSSRPASVSNPPSARAATALQTSSRPNSSRAHIETDRDPEHPVKAADLTPLTATISSKDLKSFGAVDEGPFVCVPIGHFGVLSADSFAGACGGKYSVVRPESGVLECLEIMGEQLGKALAAISQREAITSINKLFQGNRTTLHVVFEHLAKTIACNIRAAVEVRMARFPVADKEVMAEHWSEDHVRWLTKQRSFKEREVPPSIKTSGSNEFLHRKLAPPIDELVSTIHTETSRLRQMRQPVPQTPRSGGSRDQLALPATTCVALTGTEEVLVAATEDVRDVDDDGASLWMSAIVVKRVSCVTWPSDVEFMSSILPHVNSLLMQVNRRIEGIVRRRNALHQLETLMTQLKQLPPFLASQNLDQLVQQSLTLLAHAMNLHHGQTSVFLGEKQTFGKRFVLTMGSELNRSSIVGTCFDLTCPSNESSWFAQCLSHQQLELIEVTSRRLANPLGVFQSINASLVLLVPFGPDRVVCVTNPGEEVFEFSSAKKRLENDVVAFLRHFIGSLFDTFCSMRWRRDFFELVHLQNTRQDSLVLFFGTLLRILQREIVGLHSQQIVQLADDFTGKYRVVAWWQQPFVRPVFKLQEHFCFESQCDATLLKDCVHFDQQLFLPMTNLPRTLDQARSESRPAIGMEKRGEYSTPCMATMLDFGFDRSRVALCVFGESGAKAKPFTGWQVNVFTAWAAVALQSFKHVYRNCLLSYFSMELVFHLRERTNTKKAMVVALRTDSHHSEFTGTEPKAVQEAAPNAMTSLDDSATYPSSATPSTCVIFCSEGPTSKLDSMQRVSISATHPAWGSRKSTAGGLKIGESVQGKALDRLLEFHKSAALCSLRIKPLDASQSKATKQAEPNDPTHQLKATTKELDAPHSPSRFRLSNLKLFRRKANSVDKTTTAVVSHGVPSTTPPTALTHVAQVASPKATSPLRSPFNLFRRNKPVSPSKEAVIASSPAKQSASNASSKPSNGDQVSSPTGGTHFAFQLLLRSIDMPFPSAKETHLVAVDTMETTKRHEFVKKLQLALQQQVADAQELVHAFTTQPQGNEESLDLFTPSGFAGGFFLMKQLKRSHEMLTKQLVSLDAYVRTSVTRQSETESDGALVASVLRAALLCIGYRKEFAESMMTKDCFKEFVAESVVQKVLQVNPNDKRVWPAVTRARTYLKLQLKHDNKLHALALPVTMSTTGAKVHRDDPSHEPADPADVNKSSKASAGLMHPAVCSLLQFELALLTLVRFLKTQDDLKQLQAIREAHYATRVQCRFRVHRAKEMLVTLRTQRNAALTIQCAFRQLLARRKLYFLKVTRAAKLIQRAFRHRQERLHGTKKARRVMDEFHAISRQLGGLDRNLDPDGDGAGTTGNVEWKASALEFESFEKFLQCKRAKEELAKEKLRINAKLVEFAKQRELLPLEERLFEETKELFQVYDEESTGAISRSRTQDMMVRMRIPLAKIEFDDVIDMMDSDCSGDISLVEFTGWYLHEYPVLRNRRKDVGVLNRKDHNWVVESLAVRTLKRKYEAIHQAALATKEIAVGDKPPDQNQDHFRLASEEEHEEDVQGSHSDEVPGMRPPQDHPEQAEQEEDEEEEGMV